MAKKDPDIDGGYAWVILGGCFFMYMFTVGSLKSYGVLYTELLDYFGAGSGATAWIGSLCTLLLLGLGPFSNWLCVKYSFRKVAFVGGLLTGIGYVTSFFIPSIEYMYISFGVVAGLGYGLTFSPCATLISFYFEKNRALANGITVSASGIGALTFPFLYRYLILAFSLKGTFLILGGMLLNICVAACAFVQPRILRKPKKAAKDEEKNPRSSDGTRLLNGDLDTTRNASKEDKGCCSSGPDFKFSLFKNPLFVMYVIAFTLCMNGYGNNIILIPSQTKYLGYDKTHVSLSVSIMGGCEVVARVFFGWFADRNFIKRKYIFFISMLIGAVFCFIVPFFDNFIFIGIYAAIIGIFPGSFWSLMPVLMIEAVGLENFTPAFGLLSLCLGVVSVFSQPVIGVLEDKTGNWNASFYLTGCLLLLAGIVVLLEPLFAKCVKPPPPPEEVNTEDRVIPLRRRRNQRPKVTDADDSLIDDDNDVSFSSIRISKIYRPPQPESPSTPPPASPVRSSTAPLASQKEI